MADAKTYQREIVLEDAKLVEMVTRKGEMVEKGRAIAKQIQELQQQMERLQKELSPMTGHVISLKQEIFRRLKKVVGKDLQEFEVPVNADIRDGKVILLDSYTLSEFKESFHSIDKFKEPVPIKK
jgi:hypothetical protein